MNNTLILRRRGFQAYKGSFLWLRVFLGLYAFIGVGVLYYYAKETDPFSKSIFYVPFVYCFVLYFSFRNMVQSKIEIDEFGLSHESGLPDLFKRFIPDWRITWAEIESVERAGNGLLKHTVLLPLNIKLFNRTIKVIPNQWVDPEDKPKIPWFSLRNNVAPKFKEIPLLKVFAAKGLLDEKLTKSFANPKSIGTDINSSPISIGMTMFLFFAMFYFITEVYFTLSEFYVAEPPYVYMVIGAIVAMIVSYLLLLKTKFALAEKIILALMVGASMVAVMYPLMLRVNEWTDTEGLQRYAYVKSGLIDWTSESGNYQIPPLKFDLDYSKYWAQFDVGDTKQFELRKGGLGFYQLNMKPVYAEQRVFYKDK